MGKLNKQQSELLDYFSDMLIGKQPDLMSYFQRSDELQPVWDKIRMAMRFWNENPKVVAPFLPPSGMPTLHQLFNKAAPIPFVPGAIPWLAGKKEAEKLRVPITAWYAGQGIKDKWIAPPDYYKKNLK